MPLERSLRQEPDMIENFTIPLPFQVRDATVNRHPRFSTGGFSLTAEHGDPGHRIDSHRPLLPGTIKTKIILGLIISQYAIRRAPLHSGVRPLPSTVNDSAFGPAPNSHELGQ